MDYTVHGILRARVLEWVVIPFYRGSSQPRDWTGVSCTADGFSYHLSHQGNPNIIHYKTRHASPVPMHHLCLFPPINWLTFSSVQFSHSVMSNSATRWATAHQASLSITNSRVYSNSCPLSRWCHPTISSSINPFSSPHQTFQWVNSSHQVAKVLEFQLQSQSLQWIFRTDFL